MFNLSKEEITFEVVEAFCREWQEGVRVEYKREITKDTPKIVSSFANTQGGVFIIGVKANQTDNKVQFPIEGIPKTPGLEERIVQSAITGIYPSVMPEVILIDVPDSDNVVIVVRVDESIQAPHAIQNSAKVYIRTGSVTQPYELSDIDRIEYMLKRRENPKVVTQQILDRIEQKINMSGGMDAPSMTVIARPVYPYRPVISPTAIYKLFEARANTKRVIGGIACFLDPSSDLDLEINEYGIVYHRRRLCYSEESPITLGDILSGIEHLLHITKELYNACNALGNIKVIAQLQNVFEKKLSTDFGTDYSLGLSELVCHDSEVFASTSKTYLSRDFEDPAQQKTIFEDLTMQLLWAFNIPIDVEGIITRVGELIEEKIR